MRNSRSLGATQCGSLASVGGLAIPVLSVNAARQRGQTQQQAAIRAAQQACLSAARGERKTRLATLNRVGKLQAVVNELAATLVRSPENTALARLLHSASDKLRVAEAAAKQWNPMRRVSAQDTDTKNGRLSN